MKTLYLAVVRGKAINISKYPNFHQSGSIKGMKNMYYGKDAFLVRCGSYIYNVPFHIYAMAMGR